MGSTQAGVFVGWNALSGEVIVWSKPNCVQCGAVKRALDKRSIAYDERDLTADLGALEAFKGLGFLGAPIVTVDGAAEFAGFNPGEIDRIFGPAGS